jgi:Zn-dependent protease
MQLSWHRICLNSTTFFGTYEGEQNLTVVRPASLRDAVFMKARIMDSLYVLPILLFSIIVHEIAHGWMALRLGDPTARDMGRLTFNPIPHIDPIGSIAIPLLSLLSAGSIFIAWAKPVPVNPSYFRNLRRDDILVSIIGPGSNLVVALFCVIFYGLSVRWAASLSPAEPGFLAEMALFMMKMFSAGITLNIFLAVFNLIPVPPLDGSHVVSSLLPPELGERYRQIGFFGILLVILLMRFEPFRHTVIAIVLTIRLPYEALIHLIT